MHVPSQIKSKKRGSALITSGPCPPFGLPPVTSSTFPLIIDRKKERFSAYLVRDVRVPCLYPVRGRWGAQSRAAETRLLMPGKDGSESSPYYLCLPAHTLSKMPSTFKSWLSVRVNFINSLQLLLSTEHNSHAGAQRALNWIT